MTRPPRRRAGSRRESQQAQALGHHLSGRGVGPEDLPLGLYKVSLIVVCKKDGAEMGRAERLTIPAGEPGHDPETTTTWIPGSEYTEGDVTSRAVPRDFSDGHEKWRFHCYTCGADRPIADHRIDRRLDELWSPWARREERITPESLILNE